MAFLDPNKVIQELALKEGMRVADFGAGGGHYTIVAARKVGENGRVCAVDIQKDLLSRVKEESTREKLFNVDVVWGDVDEIGGSRLSEQSVDAVILTNILFQLEHRSVAVEEVSRILKPKGKVLIIDWEDSYGGMGPAANDILKPESARELFLSRGFKLEKDIGSVAGDHHYGFVFGKE